LTSQCKQIIHRNGELILRVAGKVLPHQIGRKAIETSGHRSMCREEISGSRDSQCQIKRDAVVLHIAARSFEHRILVIPNQSDLFSEVPVAFKSLVI
jgi:hypothetical protein